MSTDQQQICVRNFPKIQKAWRPDHLETMEILVGPPIAETPYQCAATEKLGARIRAKFRTEDQKLSKLCSDAGLKACRKRIILLYSGYRRARDATFMSRIHNASMRKEDSNERMHSQENENRSSLGHKNLPS